MLDRRAVSLEVVAGGGRFEGLSSHQMANAINLADPEFEPSDEQLRDLSTRAFAGVREAHELALQKLRTDITAARGDALRSLDARIASAQARK